MGWSGMFQVLGAGQQLLDPGGDVIQHLRQRRQGGDRGLVPLVGRAATLRVATSTAMVSTARLVTPSA